MGPPVTLPMIAALLVAYAAGVMTLPFLGFLALRKVFR